MSCSCGCGKKPQAKEWNMTPKFSELKRGDKVKIVGYRTGDSQYKSKLLSMGLVRGVELRVLQVAPLGDPMELNIRNYELSVRKADAEMIEVE